MNEAIYKAIEEAAHMGYVEGIKTAIEVLQGILARIFHKPSRCPLEG